METRSIGIPLSRASFVAAVLLTMAVLPAFAQSPRTVVNFNDGWRFFKGDAPGAEAPAFAVADWRTVRLPHDWGIEGPFDEQAPGQASLPTGIGWYRKHFTPDAGAAGKRVSIEFDGVYENSEVWINGKSVGERPFGYITFAYDITSQLVSGDNVVAVRVDNSAQPNSRWYSGSGIDRNVRLIVAWPAHVQHWGVTVAIPKAGAEAATVVAKTVVENEDKTPLDGIVRSTLIGPDGKQAATADATIRVEPGQSAEASSDLAVTSASLWSVEHPSLYQLRTTILASGKPIDEVVTPVGIRTIAYNATDGFLLNGERVKMNGVCLHNDGGPVGAAVPAAVWERRLSVLKAMGCNAIRTSHNPPDPVLLDLCDKMGFLVMDEAFDEWQIGKVAQGYHNYFDEWSERDVVDFVHRDRNHPSVVLWSAGNEIREQGSPNGDEVLKRLQSIFHREDPTRPVTTGNDMIAADGTKARAEFLNAEDIVGYNYVDRWHERRELYYGVDKLAHPDWKMIGTESSSVGGVRGQYSLGNDPETVRPNYLSGMIRSEQLWKFVAVHDYVIGDFMWTGIDYLGEARWPNVGASSGVIDQCGFPKDGYYFYQSQWTEKPMVHLFPHWNWPGREGQTIPVVVYSNCDAVELFLNGKSLGEKRLEFPREGNSGGWNRYDPPAKYPVGATTADLHLTWDVPYAPGVLKAVGKRRAATPAAQPGRGARGARGARGGGARGFGGLSLEEVCSDQVQTAGPAAAIRLSFDPLAPNSGSESVSHVKAEIVDDKGVVVPDAGNLIQFELGAGVKILGVGNGDPADHDPRQAMQVHAFNGLALAIVESAGKIDIRANSVGLKSADLSQIAGESATKR